MRTEAQIHQNLLSTLKHPDNSLAFLLQHKIPECFQQQIEKDHTLNYYNIEYSHFQ